MSIQTSARNQLTGTVSAITTGSVNSEVVLALQSGEKIVAMVTNASVAALGLAVGKPATALIKASSVFLLVGSAKLSARNQLTGKVKHVTDGAVNAEITLSLAGGAEIVATITLESRKVLGLSVGSEATAVIKASSVLIAV